MKKYIVVSGNYDGFNPDYNMKSEIKNGERKEIVGFNNVKRYIGHKLYYNKHGQNWECVCYDCKRFWIAQEEI